MDGATVKTAKGAIAESAQTTPAGEGHDRRDCLRIDSDDQSRGHGSDIAEKIAAKTTKPALPPREDDHEIGKLGMELLSQIRSVNHAESGSEFCRSPSVRRGVTLANFFTGDGKLRGSRQELVLSIVV